MMLIRVGELLLQKQQIDNSIDASLVTPGATVGAVPVNGIKVLKNCL